MYIYSKVLNFISKITARLSNHSKTKLRPDVPSGLSVTGFSLLELLIVIVIVGILAAVAIPAFRKSAESSKATEAYNNLNAIRKAEWTYYTKHECLTYNINDLSIENPNNILSVLEGGNRCFWYCISLCGGGAGEWAIDAFRISGPYVDCSIRMYPNGNIDESNWIQ